MKKVMNFIQKHKFNFLIGSVGIFFTYHAHIYATAQRGYKAFGGEFLILPLLIVLKFYWSTMKEGWEEL